MGAADPNKSSVAFNDDPTQDQITASERTPGRSYLFSPTQPLHFGLTDALPADRPTPKNFLAVVARKDITDAFALGATFTSVDPFAPRCTPADFSSAAAYAAANCAGQGGQAFGLDWNLRSSNRDWVVLGTVTGTRREGGPQDDVQRDGTNIHPGDLGYGGYLRAGKFGGDGLRADVIYSYQSPRLDLNEMGFLSSQNQQRIGGNLRYVRTKGLSFFRDTYAAISAVTYWTTDGQFIPRGNYFSLEMNATFPGYENFGFVVNLDNNRYDVREVDQAGVPFQKRDDMAVFLYGNTDPNRLVSGRLQTFVLPHGHPGARARGHRLRRRHDADRPPASALRDAAAAALLVRPGRRALPRHPGRPRRARPHGAALLVRAAGLAELLGDAAADRGVHADDDASQVYAQLFSAYAHYPRYYEGAAGPDAAINVAELRPTMAPSNYDFHSAALNLNVVLRWEYRLGSTLFLVYSRAQSELGYQADQNPTTALFPLRLGPGLDDGHADVQVDLLVQRVTHG